MNDEPRIRSCWAIRYRDGKSWGLVPTTALVPTTGVVPMVFASREEAKAHIETEGETSWTPVRLSPPAVRRKKRPFDGW